LAFNASELILAEEQGIFQNFGLLKNESGTLVLTNKRLVYLRGEEFFYNPSGYYHPLSTPSQGTGIGPIPPVFFAEVYDVSEIPADLPSAPNPASSSY